MSDSTDAGSTGAYGRAAEQWDRRLDAALEERDHDALRLALAELREEMDHEADAVQRHEQGPHLDRLVEQGRRLLSAGLTEQAALEDELSRERRVWADFRRRYRQTFVPAVLHSYIESSALFLRPRDDGAQFAGHDKYAARGDGRSREAVTLFVRQDAGEGGGGTTPANFFTMFEAGRGRFTVRRAYRTGLPRSAGQACLAEHLAWLVPDPGSLCQFVWDNVQNGATYAAVVDGFGENARLRAGVGADDCPLGRLGRRLLDGSQLRVAGMRPVLDGFGFLDLVLEVEQNK